MATNIGLIPSGSKVAVGTVYPKSIPFNISCGFKPAKLMFFICQDKYSPNTAVYQYAESNLLLTCYWNGTGAIGLYIVGESSGASYYFYPYNSGSYSPAVTISANSTGCTVNSDSVYGPWPYLNGTPYQWIAWT